MNLSNIFIPHLVGAPSTGNRLKSNVSAGCLVISALVSQGCGEVIGIQIPDGKPACAELQSGEGNFPNEVLINTEANSGPFQYTWTGDSINSTDGKKTNIVNGKITIDDSARLPLAVVFRTPGNTDELLINSLNGTEEPVLATFWQVYNPAFIDVPDDQLGSQVVDQLRCQIDPDFIASNDCKGNVIVNIGEASSKIFIDSEPSLYALTVTDNRTLEKDGCVLESNDAE